MDQADIVLVGMPFAPFWVANAGIGVLKGSARKAGLSVQATYPAIRLGRKIGTGLYNFVSESYLSRHILLADWLFAGPLSERAAQVPPEYEQLYRQGLRRFPHRLPGPEADGALPSLSGLRRCCADFVDEEARRVTALAPRIVGCSSTFFQHAASIAFLKRIKSLRPDVVTMIGGANCEAEMGRETARQFPWIDYVFSGEADLSFPVLCRRILTQGRPVPTVDLPYGVYTHEKASADQDRESALGDCEVAQIDDLDTAGQPDYDEYFQELADIGITDRDSRACAIEASRGCEKGQHSLCNFCGLNGARLCYRSKSKEHFMSELRALSQRYESQVFLLTDNIVGREAFSGWLREAATEKSWTFFMETRSTLDEHQIKTLADAEAYNLQPGIESLDDHLLRLMNKGNSALANIALLKYGQEQGIRISWNMLYGVPGEEPADYLRLAELIPWLHHLQPPYVCSPISFCRFSPYQRTPKKFGLKLTPLPGYRFVYPNLEEKALRRLAYHFDATEQDDDSSALAQAKQQMLRQAQRWADLHQFAPGSDKNSIERDLPSLTMVETNGLIKIRDHRPCALSSHFLLDELESEVYRQTRAPITLAVLRAQIARQPGLEPALPGLEQRLQALVESRLLLRLGERYLGLATNPRRRPSARKLQGFKNLIWRSEYIYPTPCSTSSSLTPTTTPNSPR